MSTLKSFEPFNLPVQDIDELIELLTKVKRERGNLPVKITYHEYSKGEIRIGTGAGLYTDEYLDSQIQVYHGGELIEGF